MYEENNRTFIYPPLCEIESITNLKKSTRKCFNPIKKNILQFKQKRKLAKYAFNNSGCK